jgi:DNA-binding response OmpR family regulator
MGQVLVVDDDSDIRESLREVLELEGYDVTTASDGEEALRSVHDCPPCMMLLDLMMPRVSGWDVLDELRRTHTVVPVAIVTASQEIPLGYPTLSKPLDLRALLTIVAANCGVPMP